MQYGSPGQAFLPVTGAGALMIDGLFFKLVGLALISIFVGIIIFRLASKRQRLAAQTGGITPGSHRRNRRRSRRGG